MDRISVLYKEWLDLQPLKDEYKHRLDEKMMLEFNYNSNHIEGNTLTYGQTELLLKFGEVMDSAKMKDLEDMKAHNLCLNIIKEEAKDNERPLTESFIRNLHHTMLREDYPETKNGKTYTVHAGIYKTRPNSVKTITGELFEYASVEETPALMSDLVAWYNKEENEKRLSAIELATLFHYRYIRIHPFEDGNGRIARLLMNYMLVKHSYPMIVVKTKDKENYLSALHQCDINVGSLPHNGVNANIEQIKPFVNYTESCMEYSLRLYIRAAKGENIEEDDDWRKVLKIKYQNQVNKPKLTADIKQNIGGEYISLLEKIDSELYEFYPIFSDVKWLPERCRCEEVSLNEYKSEIIFKKDLNAIKTTLSLSICVKLTTFSYTYAIYMTNANSDTTIFEKRLFYNEILDKKTTNEIINTIGKELKEFLES